MATLEDLPEKLRNGLTTLFCARNYCFATHSAGRTPTFYFATGGKTNLQSGRPNGRLRTMHNSGVLIEITSVAKHHWFFKTKQEQIDARTAAKSCEDKFELSALEKKMRKTPKAGYFHYEFRRGPRIDIPMGIGHKSGGTVDLTRITRDDTFIDILNSMLATNCSVKIDNEKLQITEGLPAPTRSDLRSLRAYLDSLG